MHGLSRLSQPDVSGTRREPRILKVPILRARSGTRSEHVTCACVLRSGGLLAPTRDSHGEGKPSSITELWVSAAMRKNLYTSETVVALLETFVGRPHLSRQLSDTLAPLEGVDARMRVCFLVERVAFKCFWPPHP